MPLPDPAPSRKSSTEPLGGSWSLWIAWVAVPPWLVVLPLLAPIGILTTFNHWSLQYVFDGFSVPPEVAEGFSWGSFWSQVLIFWVWGVPLTAATAIYAARAWRERLGPRASEA